MSLPSPCFPVPLPWGSYELLRVLHYSLLSEVLYARDTKDGQMVVIKRPTPTALETWNGRSRLEREALHLSSLDHPAFPRVLEYGTFQGIPYLVMEYCPSLSLSRLLPRVPKRWSPTLRRRVLALVALDLCSGLRHLHHRQRLGQVAGTGHGDLGPGNLLVDSQGRGHIVDLGMAHASLQERAFVFRTRFPDFAREGLETLSPEQLDVRSLAATLSLCFQRLDIAHLSPFVVPLDLTPGPGPTTHLQLPESLDELEGMCKRGLTIDGRVRGKLGDLVASRLKDLPGGVPSTGVEPPR